MTKTQFRMLVLVSLALLLVVGPVGASLADSLPADLEAFVNEQAEGPFSGFDYLSLAALIGLVAAHIGLVFFARWARPLYVVSVVCAVTSTLAHGPYVGASVETMIYDVGTLLDGVIIAASYSSLAGAHFARNTA